LQLDNIDCLFGNGGITGGVLTTKGGRTVEAGYRQRALNMEGMEKGIQLDGNMLRLRKVFRLLHTGVRLRLSNYRFLILNRLNEFKIAIYLYFEIELLIKRETIEGNFPEKTLGLVASIKFFYNILE